MDSQKRTRLFALLDPWISDLGFECIEIEWEQSTSTLIIYVDHVGRPITLDDCTKISKVLNDKTELDNFFSKSFHLSVSSPGVERPLRFAKHFRAALGKNVKVSLTEKYQNRANGSGTLLEVSDGPEKKDLTVSGEYLKVGLDGSEKNVWSFPVAAVKKAQLVYNWDEK